jgi:hypothetical protein
MPEREFGIRSLSRTENELSSRSGTLYDTGTHSRSASSSDHPRSNAPISPSNDPSSPSSSSPLRPPRPLAENRQPSQVFVVHHDGGRAPVTVYTSDGTEVVELPPQYVDTSSSSNAVSTTSTSGNAVTGSVAPLQFQERRQPAPTPPKSPRRVVN